MELRDGPTDEDFSQLEDALDRGGEEADLAVLRFLVEWNYLVVRCVRTGAIFAVPNQPKVLH